MTNFALKKMGACLIYFKKIIHKCFNNNNIMMGFLKYLIYKFTKKTKKDYIEQTSFMHLLYCTNIILPHINNTLLSFPV